MLFGDLLNVTSTNIEFGSDQLKGSDILFTNGGEDQWQWCGVTKTSGSMQAVLIDCENCGHCVELYDEKDGEDTKLKDAREKVRNFVGRIIGK